MDHHHHHIPIFQEYPLIGYGLTLISIMVGTIIPTMTENHIPPIIMEGLQAAVWVTGIVVGIFTLYGMWKKRNNPS